MKVIITLFLLCLSVIAYAQADNHPTCAEVQAQFVLGEEGGYCIDKWPTKERVTYAEARQMCDAVEKRLCKPDEWLRGMEEVVKLYPFIGYGEETEWIESRTQLVPAEGGTLAVGSVCGGPNMWSEEPYCGGDFCPLPDNQFRCCKDLEFVGF